MTTSIPNPLFPGEASIAVNNGRKLTPAWAKWAQNMDRAVRRLLEGVNDSGSDAAQAEADAQTAITNAAAAQTTANAALPKAGGTMTGPLVLKSYTVATLPAAPGAGATAIVTDSSGTTFAAALIGGGANTVPVYYNGTSWRIG
jgi:hypothetical protein